MRQKQIQGNRYESNLTTLQLNLNYFVVLVAILVSSKVTEHLSLSPVHTCLLVSDTDLNTCPYTPLFRYLSPGV